MLLRHFLDLCFPSLITTSNVYYIMHALFKYNTQITPLIYRCYHGLSQILRTLWILHTLMFLGALDTLSTFVILGTLITAL